MGTSSGVRFVIGAWESSPWGSFTDVMLQDADDHRVLLAPDATVASYVAQTYHFDEVQILPVELQRDGRTWRLAAGDLRAVVTLGDRTPVGRLLRVLPGPLARTRTFAAVADPVARVVLPGVRTRGSAGNGRREYYCATDQHALSAVRGSWRGADLGSLARVEPTATFGFSSTPSQPCATAIRTHVSLPPTQ